MKTVFCSKMEEDDNVSHFLLPEDSNSVITAIETLHYSDYWARFKNETEDHKAPKCTFNESSKYRGNTRARRDLRSFWGQHSRFNSN